MGDEAGHDRGLHEGNLIELDIADDAIDQRWQEAAENDSQEIANGFANVLFLSKQALSERFIFTH